MDFRTAAPSSWPQTGTIVRRYTRNDGTAIACSGEKPDIDLTIPAATADKDVLVKDTVNRTIARSHEFVSQDGEVKAVSISTVITGEIEADFKELRSDLRYKEVSGKLKRVLTVDGETYELDLPHSEHRTYHRPWHSYTDVGGEGFGRDHTI